MTDSRETSSSGFTRLRTFVDRYGVYLWVSLLIGCVGLFVVQQRTEIVNLNQTLQAAQARWLLVALALAVTTIGLLGLEYQAILRRLGHRLDLPSLVRIHLERQVVGTLVPLGGPPSMYVFARFLKSRRVPMHDALFALILYSLVGYASFLIFMLPIMLWLQLTGQATTLVLLGAVALIGIFTVSITGVVLLLRERIPAAWMGGRIAHVVAAFASHSRRHQLRPNQVLRALSYAVLVKGSGGLLLYACLLAVGADPSPATILVGYVVGMLFSFIAPVFQGAGVVELSMVVALKQFGVAGDAALAGTLLYRFFDIWLPLMLGIAVLTGVRVQSLWLSHAPARLRLWTRMRANTNTQSIARPKPLPVRIVEPREDLGD